MIVMVIRYSVGATIENEYEIDKYLEIMVGRGLNGEQTCREYTGRMQAIRTFHKK